MKRFESAGLARGLLGALALGMAALSVPAAADVRTGVDAWSRGDYAAAVAQWEGPAAAGDADAMFNLAQAYRLGRGVAQDEVRAEQLYFRAAQSGHVQAADTYGLMLFQAGRREEALPFVEDAARRGDPRSQYLLGIAHFNGDLVERDWVRAYALLTLANSAGLPQAAPAISQMDGFIELADRQQAAGLAETMRAEADSIRSAEFAAADLGAEAGAPAHVAAAPQSRVPQPIATVAVSPSVAAARAAIEEASRATGTDDPARAGVAYAEPRAQAPAPTPAPARNPAPAATVARASTGGPWRVQLGAFSVRSNAEQLWARLSSRSEIAGRERLLVPTGRVVRLQVGGYASQSEAQSACSSLQRSGQDCLVTRN
ncbi:SPOR domain-containing protein [Altererythrobacter sp. KTW20L]|uniref:SPOR domain-containing protein n=1 Tax=Altererythrobacter sp. KTW20L TaxID=2942210 RepID=UPI0020BF08B8|nr:SPOR domain-containing protein [Altererythrobacter sp. KTW20L]MCL6250915.1 SPOR domain-containing protein [Altererythrobacter sp. KTW20L]